MTDYSRFNNNIDGSGADPEQPDENISSGSHIFAGAVISDDTIFENLKRLIISMESIPVKRFETEISRLSTQLKDGQDADYINFLLSNSLEHYYELQKLNQSCGEGELLDYKFDAYLNFVDGMNSTLDMLESILKKELNNTEGSSFDICDDSYNNLFAVKVLKYRLSLCCASIKEPFYTNISSILVATTPDSHAHYDIENYYTTASPSFICAALAEILTQKQLFFDALITKSSRSTDVTDVILALEDQAFDFTGLSFIITTNPVCIDQDEHNIILKFDCPGALYNLAQKHLDSFEEMLSPLNDILKAIGGGISTHFEADKLILTLFCPEQDSPPIVFDKMFSDAEIFAKCRGNNTFTTMNNGFRFELKRGQSSRSSTPLIVKLPPNSFDSVETRTGIAHALRLARQLDSFTPLQELVFDYQPNSKELSVKYIFATPLDDTLLVVPNTIERITISTQALTNSTNATKICDILKIANCKKLFFTGDALSVGTQLSGIIKAICKARSLFSEELQLSYGDYNRNGMPILEICTGDDLLIMARYEDGTGTFAGRCHAPELTHKVSEIFNTILKKESRANLDVNDRFFVDNLANRLANLGVLVTDRFRSFLHALTTKSNVNNLTSFNSDLQTVLLGSIMSIERIDKKILLDIPDLRDIPKDDFFTNQTI